MALSSDLISKFVKATKDEPVDKKETVVYGVVTQTNPIRVRLVESNSTSDSSTVYTEEIPVTTTTTVVEVGDKVECTIKNHKLSITGTSDYPAARRDSTINKEDLVASKIKVDTLDAANVTVQQMLDAHQATIDELDATYVRVDELDAKFITAEELEADYIKADEIKSTYATISALEAVDAKIDNLDVNQGNIDNLTSDIAKINNLIFGSATGDVIQTSFSNAVISQLGDAQIKSAMIESVSAGKITAGDIITNNVRVKSEDGSLIISDETLQISDSTRVRVQIGKDAASDYSINVWDQNGNLMFSKGGITDAAIKEAIIRNDMVSDTANIHASKLDIDSLFEEINDSSNTIKSTKVYLDDEKQTLDVAFKSLTTEVTNQGETISSQGTAISTVQGQISSKIWQQDINTAKNEMSTQYSTLEQEVDGFKTTVSETYVTNTDLDNLKIGGRNLLLNSAAAYSVFFSEYSSASIRSATESKITTITADKGNAYCFLHDHFTISPEDIVEEGGEYTFSADIKLTGNFTNFSIGLDIRSDAHGYSRAYKVTLPCDEHDRWVRVSTTGVIAKGEFDDYTKSVFVFNWDASTIGSIAECRNVKLEKGNKPTGWTPAPEDIDSKISANQTLIEQTATDLTVKIESAAKTATNYLNFSSSGLVIGDMTASALGKNVLIDSDSVDIRNGDATLASFGADYLYLAKNSRNAKIDLCNGLATLYHESKYSYDTIFIIDTGNTTEIMGLITPLCVTSVDDLDNVSIQFANANGVMGGIGIVGSYLRRFGSNMFDTYTLLDSGNYFDVMDDGWHYTGGYGDNFTQYNNETHSKVRYRKVGGVVEVRGALKATTTIEGSDTKHTMFTLPEGYRPDCRIVQRCQGSGMHTWMLTVEESGAVTFSRYGVGTSYSDVGTTVWLPIQITFLVN